MPRGSRRHKRQRPANDSATQEKLNVVSVQEWKYNHTGDEDDDNKDHDDDDDDDDDIGTTACLPLPPPISSLLDLPPMLREKLQRVGIQAPTEIQKYVWPILLQLSSPGGRGEGKKQHKNPPPQEQCHHPNEPNNKKGEASRKTTNHLICLSPTASGKTFAYGILPIVYNNHNNPTTTSTTVGHHHPYRNNNNNNNIGISISSTQKNMLILTPTRELTQQVQRNLQTLHAHPTTTNNNNDNNNVVVVLAIYGGRADRTEQYKELETAIKLQQQQQQQKTTLQQSCIIIVATPGRLWDLLSLPEQEEGKCNKKKDADNPGLFWKHHPNHHGLITTSISTIVLDEADRLAMDASLREQVSGIIKNIVQYHNNHSILRTDKPMPRMILASATWPDRVSSVWKDWIDSLNNCHYDTNDKTNHKSRTYSIVVQSTQQQQQYTTMTTTVATATATATTLATTNTTNPNAPSTLLAANIPSTIRQVIHVCSAHKRRKKLLKTIQSEQEKNGSSTMGLVFFATIHELKATGLFLRQQNISGIVLIEWHGQLSQNVRDDIQQLLLQTQPYQQEKRQFVILATDIAARGIHNDMISYVIQYDFSTNLEQYIHRCGRIRNKQGTSYGFFLRKFKSLAKDLVQLLENSQQMVDPNLRALVDVVDTAPDGCRTPSSKRLKRTLVSAQTNIDPSDQDHNHHEDDDSFPELSGQRIILKRAEHVSEPSSDESEAEENGICVAPQLLSKEEKT